MNDSVQAALGTTSGFWLGKLISVKEGRLSFLCMEVFIGIIKYITYATQELNDSQFKYMNIEISADPTMVIAKVSLGPPSGVSLAYTLFAAERDMIKAKRTIRIKYYVQIIT